MATEEIIGRERAAKPAKENEFRTAAKLVVVRVRGMTGLRIRVADTLEMLRLYSPNYCVVVKDTPSIRGMIQKACNYVTWGEIDEETFKLLVSKRGKEYTGRISDSKGKIDYKHKFIEIDGRKIKPYFMLQPPRKGYGRKGIKVDFKIGGALGYRGRKINELIKRMV